MYVQIPMAVRSTAWFCGSSLGGIVVSNSVYVSLLCVLCIIREWSPRRSEHSPRGFLPSVVCLSVISKYQNREALGPHGLSRH